MEKVKIKNLYKYIGFILITFLLGCSRNLTSVNQINVEIGSELSKNPEDYISIKDKKKEVSLDLSNVNVMCVGEYNALILYDNKQIVVPVYVEDTTAPVIYQNNVQFEESTLVRPEELVMVEDFSDTKLFFLSNRDESEMESIYLYPEQSVTIKAVDIYGNETVQEIYPNIIFKDDNDIESNKKGYATWLDFSYREMELADDGLYRYIAECYSNVGWYGVVEKGNVEKYDSYKRAFTELILQERMFVDIKTGKEILLGDYENVVLPDDLNATYDMEDYDYCFFDMDGGGTQELIVFGNGIGLIFKYIEDEDKIYLWEEIKSGFYQLVGTGILLFSDGANNFFYKWNEEGKIECIVHFFTRSSDGDTIYCVSLPDYIQSEKSLYVPRRMKEIGCLDKTQNRYYVQVTEEEYNMLTNDFFKSYKQGEENMAMVTYTYEEFLSNIE